MGLFDFLIGKSKLPPVRDLVWIDQGAKRAGISEMVTRYGDAIWLGWFEETIKSYSGLITAPNTLKSAGHIHASSVQGKIVVFVEHYPLKTKEMALIESWRAQEVIFLNALDEPLFQCFGGAHIVSLMRRLQVHPQDMLEHTMITKSIGNAQRKLDKKVRTEVITQDASEWFRKNLR